MKIQPRIEQGGVTLLFSTAEEAAEIYRLLAPLFNGSNVETKPVQATTPAPQPPEPQPVASVKKPPVEKTPKPKSIKRRGAFLPETVLFFRELETARRKYNKERNRKTTRLLSVISVFRHFRFYARQWNIKLAPLVTQEIMVRLKGVRDSSLQSYFSRMNLQPSTSTINNQTQEQHETVSE